MVGERQGERENEREGQEGVRVGGVVTMGDGRSREGGRMGKSESNLMRQWGREATMTLNAIGRDERVGGVTIRGNMMGRGVMTTWREEGGETRSTGREAMAIGRGSVGDGGRE
ncbi:unnamed protein product, partial [Closterium sp. NIES-64]